MMPDLIAVPASELSIHLNKKTGIRRLRFTSSLGNVGVGPIEVRPNQKQPCPVGQRNATQIVYRDLNVDGLFEPLIDTSVFRHRAGCMIYHPTHHHWHFKASAQYVLYRPARACRPWSAPAQGELLPPGHGPAAVALRVLRLPEAYGACTARAAGHLDRLDGHLPELPRRPEPAAARRLPNGLYCLTTSSTRSTSSSRSTTTTTRRPGAPHPRQPGPQPTGDPCP
jgi:hypothetical protein